MAHWVPLPAPGPPNTKTIDAASRSKRSDSDGCLLILISILRVERALFFRLGLMQKRRERIGESLHEFTALAHEWDEALGRAKWTVSEDSEVSFKSTVYCISVFICRHGKTTADEEEELILQLETACGQLWASLKSLDESIPRIAEEKENLSSEAHELTIDQPYSHQYIHCNFQGKRRENRAKSP